LGKAIKFSIVGIILLALAALALFNNQNKITKDEGFVTNKEDYISNNIASIKQFSLPEFSSTDIFGKTINTSLLKGKKAFIQFIDPKSESQIEVLKRVCQGFKDEESTITVFIKDSEGHMFERFMDEIRFALGDISIITENYDKYKNIFKVPPCCETFNLFNEKGKLIASDLNRELYYEKDIRIYLNRLVEKKNRVIKKKKFFVSNYIKLGENVKNNDFLKPLAKVIEGEEYFDYYVMSMFDNVCTACQTGKLINRLKELHKLDSTYIYFLIILSDNYNENDINNFKTHLKISIPVIRADKQLSNNWNQLMKEFSNIELNNIIFLMDKKGKIIKLMEPDNREEFFSYLSKMSEL